MSSSHSNADDKDANDVLARFVGPWKISGEAKPAEWAPECDEIAARESAVWVLNKRVVLIRAVDDSDQKKALWIVTHDQKQNDYPIWGFDSKGLTGAHWRNKWDSSISKLTGQAADLPEGWTSGGQNHFTSADTNVLDHWIRNENDELLLHHVGKKQRLPAGSEPAIVTEWNKHNPADDLPAELKVFDRMVGTWDAVHIMKPAVWTPDGDRTTSTIKRKWILDGRVLLDTSTYSTGRKGMSVLSFDPQRKMYRTWWFNSKGHRGLNQGEWNEKTQTFNLVGAPQDGKTARGSARFPDSDHEVIEVKVTDVDGKVYFDMDIILTRREKEEN